MARVFYGLDLRFSRALFLPIKANSRTPLPFWQVDVRHMICAQLHQHRCWRGIPGQ
jgi:hypothetical protein